MLEVHAILQRQRCNENITKKTGTLSDAYKYGRKRQVNCFSPKATSKSIAEKQCPGARDSSLELWVRKG